MYATVLVSQAIFQGRRKVNIQKWRWAIQTDPYGTRWTVSHSIKKCLSWLIQQETHFEITADGSMTASRLSYARWYLANPTRSEFFSLCTLCLRGKSSSSSQLSRNCFKNKHTTKGKWLMSHIYSIYGIKETVQWFVVAKESHTENI